MVQSGLSEIPQFSDVMEKQTDKYWAGKYSY